LLCEATVLKTQLCDTHVIRLHTEPTKPDPWIIAKAAEVIRSGGLVAFPTETVYGLGANALDPKAILKVFRAKGRPPDNPLIIHIESSDALLEVTSRIPEWLWDVLRKVWPGPVTFVLNKSPKIPKEATGGKDTVAVRVPSHPVALSLIKEAGVPIAAPSANKSGRPSPTLGDHVVEDLGDSGLVDILIDAGPTFLGVESTVVDVTRDPPILLRPGPFTVEDLEEVLGREIIIPPFAKGLGEAEEALSPGMKYKHYSPSTPLILIECPSQEGILETLRRLIQENKDKRICLLITEETRKHLGVDVPIIVLGSRDDVYGIARNLFDALRKLDKLNVDLGIIEGINDVGIGLAIMNRLRKASGKPSVRCGQ